MSVSIAVPLNTMLADLDESLRRLVRRELEAQGFEGVSIAFDAPTKEWSAGLSSPTLNLFLYDLREAVALREREWREDRGNGRARLERPPLRVECSYAVTAWTRAVEDEHRMLSHALAVLHAYDVLGEDVLVGSLAQPGSSRYAVTTRIGQPKGDDKSDFWNAVGGTYRVSLDYVVILTCEPGVTLRRGPEVRTATMRLGPRTSAGRRAQLEEQHRIGGRVTDTSGGPVADVWVVLPDVGVWGTSDREGRFHLARVPTGTHRVLARTADGSEVASEVTVPLRGPGLVLSVAGPPG